MMVTGHQSREVLERYNIKDAARAAQALGKVGVSKQLKDFEYQNEYH
jgi:hypothetical protein